jgi:voltage-gated potassium channel
MHKERSPLRNTLIAMAGLCIVVVTGTAGYMLIGKWTFTESVYMTVITLASVGFREVRELDAAGQWFTIGLILFGMGTLVYGITNLTAFIVEGELNKLLRRSRMDKNLDKLNNHFILCGIGRVGTNIAEEIVRMGYPLVAIDSQEINLMSLETMDPTPFQIRGDATEEKTLEKAGIRRARGFVSALPADSENLFVVMTARQLNPSLRIIARVNEEENSQKMIRAGADKTVCPSHIGGLRMASELLRPAAVDFLDKMIREKDGTLRVEEASVASSSPISGKTLAEAQIPKRTGCVVVALRRKDGSFQFNPSADTNLSTGDALIVIGEIPKITELKKLAGDYA